jgi:hypothetical protein
MPLEPPINARAPSIFGVTAVGVRLVALRGTWLGATRYARQWLRDGVDIVGATGITYKLVAADHGAMIGVVITATNVDGSASVEAVVVGPVEASPPR